MGSAKLEFRVLVTKRPSATRNVPPGHENIQWVGSSSTLIYGERDAVLVDTFLNRKDNEQLVEWVANSGKELKFIYVTHGHGDHFYGLQMLLHRFPKARAIATPESIELMKEQAGEGRKFWESLFPNQLPDTVTCAEPLSGNEFELEGNKLFVHRIGFTDTHDTTMVHVPSIDLVVAGDSVYGNTFPYFSEQTPETRLEWIKALETIESLNPKVVIAGHSQEDVVQDVRNVESTKKYLNEVVQMAKDASTKEELFEKIISSRPHWVNGGSAWSAANRISQWEQ
jgi:glyoxylase-like metal-dependent hydrolase (beta-lactamase superfamily II)